MGGPFSFDETHRGGRSRGQLRKALAFCGLFPFCSIRLLFRGPGAGVQSGLGGLRPLAQSKGVEPMRGRPARGWPLCHCSRLLVVRRRATQASRSMKGSRRRAVEEGANQGQTNQFFFLFWTWSVEVGRPFCRTSRAVENWKCPCQSAFREMLRANCFATLLL